MLTTSEASKQDYYFFSAQCYFVTLPVNDENGEEKLDFIVSC